MKRALGVFSRALGVFSRASTFLHADSKITLFNTLVLPHFDYCSTVWGSNMKKADIVRLQRLQNRAMRIILQCHPRTHILDMLRTLKWMSVKQRLFYNLCIFLWKIVNNQVPSYLQNIFTPVTEVHSYQTRASTSCKFFRSRSSPKTLSFIGTKIWNELPQHVRDARSLFSFKKSCIQFIFDHVEPL